MSGTRFLVGWTPKFRIGALREGRFLTVRGFLGCLAFVYFIAFLSFEIQAVGLIGSHGILPVSQYLKAVRETVSTHAWWYVPSVLWLDSSDRAIRAVCLLGTVFAAIAMFARWQRVPLAVCWILWLSLSAAGQDFLSFQWDVLLLEAGFLALFADASKIRVILFRWLVFRLMFASGVVKLLSQDPAWRNLTALHFHYETQPLPTPLAWYLYQLPLAFQKISTFLVFVAELAVPFFFFAPKRLRHIAACVTIALQILILLTIFLTMWLFIPIDPAPRPRVHQAVSIALAAFIAILSSIVCLETFGIQPPGAGAELLHTVAPFGIVNSYGLFAVMTTTRQEIVVEGSADGVSWQAYEFRYKPGDPFRAPPLVVRRPGQLPAEPVVPELRRPPARRRALRAPPLEVQPLPQCPAPLCPRATLSLPLHAFRRARLVDARGKGPLLPHGAVAVARK